MRVSDQQMVSSALLQMQSQLLALHNAQTQVSSGRKVSNPSDDPAAAAGILELQVAQQSNAQELRNAQDGQAWVQGADNQLQQADGILQEVRNLTVQAASSTDSTTDAAIAAQIRSLRDQLVSIANAQQGGRGLFAGFASGPAVTQVAGTWTYTGDAGQVQRRVGPQEKVSVNVTGDQVFGFGGPAGSDTFSMLDTLANQVAAGNTSAVSASIGSVDTALGHVNQGLAAIGNAGARIAKALELNSASAMNIQTQLSNLQDVDLAEATMNLQTQQVAYQAALGALSKVLQPSLLNFLPAG